MPLTGNFVERDVEIREMEKCLLPSDARERRKTYILYGLGGIGKTRLAAAFARKHQQTFSAILWLNGNSKDTLMRSLAAFAQHAGLIRLAHSTNSASQCVQDEEVEAQNVLRWLSCEENHRWLAVFDNVDREYPSRVGDSQAYDITSFLPTADHGSVLITTRLASLGEIGMSKKVQILDLEQALELLSDRSGLPQSTRGIESLSHQTPPLYDFTERFPRYGQPCEPTRLSSTGSCAGRQISPGGRHYLYKILDII